VGSAFQWVADRFPTEKVEQSLLLKALWRALFGLLRPKAPVVVRTRDYRIEVDPRRKYIGRTILRRGGLDRLVTDHFRARVRPGMLVVDVGANLGHYAMVAARALGGTGEVRAYEPDPETHAALRANLARNDFANVVASPKALAERRGVARLFPDRANSGGHSLARDNALDPAEAVEVETATLDEELEGRRIDVLKIDAQGAEGRILEGARGTLRRSDAAVYLEFWPHGLDRCGSDPASLLAAWAGLGYAAQVVDRRAGRIRPPRPGELERAAASRDYHVALNLFLARCS